MTRWEPFAYAAGAVLALLLLSGCRDAGARPRFVEQGMPVPSETLGAVADPQAVPGPFPSAKVDTATSARTPAVALHLSTRMVTEVQPVAYPTRIVDDATLNAGARRVLTHGVPGSRTVTYRVTFLGEQQSAKELVRSVVTKRPVTMVVAVGTRTPRQDDDCNANYSGCVPVTVDVDCAGGGNGPVYVRGPIEVVGIDIYHLDLDGNALACDGPDDIP